MFDEHLHRIVPVFFNRNRHSANIGEIFGAVLKNILLLAHKVGFRSRLKQNPHDFVIVAHLVFVGQAGDTLAGDNERRSVAFALVHVRTPFDELLDFLDVPVFHRDNEFCALLLVFPVVSGNGCGVFEGIVVNIC